MNCPHCGYVMDAFEKDCPRCANTRAHPPAVVPDTRNVPLPSRMKHTARDTSSQFRVTLPVKLPKLDTPELGWTLTVSLWIVIGVNVLAASIPFIYVLLFSGNIIFAILGAFSPGLRLLGAIGILRSQRWGFWVYTVFAVLPVFFTLMIYGIGWLFTNVMGILELCLNVLPSILIFFLVLGKWNEFE